MNKKEKENPAPVWEPKGKYAPKWRGGGGEGGGKFP